jgi:outer membrane protein assembly factor BamA
MPSLPSPRPCGLILTLLLGAALPAVGQIVTRDPGVEPVLAEIVIEGNTDTERWLVEEVIDLEPGDPFSLAEFDAVWDRLEDCGYFAFVDLDTREDEQGQVTLLVTVEEEKTTRVTPYVRYDRRHKYFLGGALTDTNLRGKGEVLDLQASALYTQRLQASWTKPWLFGVEGLELRLDTRWHRAPFVFRPFDYTAWHARADVRRTLADRWFLEAGGGYESFDQRDRYAWPTGGEVVQHPAGRRETWLWHARAGVDTRDNAYYPERGVYAAYDFTYRFGGDLDGQATHAVDLRGFVPLPGAPILALHGRLTDVDTPQYPEHVLRWGGPQTVRGAPFAGREGDRAYLASAELRWPLVLMPVAVTGEVVGLGLHAFTDVGDAFFDDRVDTDPRALFSYGAGVHVNLLTWQLRFEAAKERDGDWTFEFMDVFNF